MINFSFRLPFILTIDGHRIRFRNILTFLKHYKYYYKEIDIDGWKFNTVYGLLYLGERNRWKKDYIPFEGIKGKTILDIGAGCGETAKFFLDNGAKQIICIEPYNEAYKYLKINSENHDNILSLQITYNNDLINAFKYDIIKMDIEGYEILLLEDDILKNINKTIMIEVHNKYMVDRFLMNGFKRLYKKTVDSQLRGETTVMHRNRFDYHE